MTPSDTTSTRWDLVLYVAGMTPTATRALANIDTICRQHLEGSYSLDVVDLVEQPALADAQQIIAVPTLVRRLPPPLRKLIGDLSDTGKVLAELEIEIELDG